MSFNYLLDIDILKKKFTLRNISGVTWYVIFEGLVVYEQCQDNLPAETLF